MANLGDSNKSMCGMPNSTSEQESVKEIIEIYDISKTETFIVIPPDGGWGWTITFASFFTNFITDGVMYTFGLFLEDVSKSLNCSTTKVALVNSVMTGCFFLTGPLTSAFINRCGYRVVAMFGGISSSIFLLAISYSTRLSSLLFCGICCGISFGMVFLSSVIVVSLYFERRRALAQSIASCGSSVGISCFPLIFATLFANQSWRFKFKVLASCGLLCSICGSFYRNLKSVKVVEEMKLPNQLKGSSDGEQTESRHSKLLYRCNNIECPTGSELYNFTTIVVKAPKRISSTSMTDMSYSESVLTISNLSKAKSRIKISVEKLHTLYEGQEDENPPKRRNDVVGSLAALPEYVKSVQAVVATQEKSSLEYHLSVTRSVTQTEIEQEFNHCVCFPESMKRSLETMLDFTVLESKAFVLISLSGLFTVLGLYTPFMFFVDRAVAFGIERPLAYHIITIIGIANTLGRILSGISSTLYSTNAIIIAWVGLMINALAIIMSSLSFTVSWQFSFAFIYGISIGGVVALRPLIIVDIVGLPKLTNAYGISIVFQGIACLIGIPLSSYLKSFTDSYQMPFYFAGGATFISALLLIPVKQVHKWEKTKTTILE
ncbi:hypothetical protein FQR65_LT06106 [Abscondita terminalis]|nr:hypothetical protein FQR65_LT06106 [Abscondita terminalis]